MASNIKGITIEIGGNTTGLQKALEDVNKKSRDIQYELREVDKLLKLDPKNTELLAQKQKLLGEAVSNTKDKLSTLKDAERQAKIQFEQGTLGEEKYRALQREVAKAEQELKKLENQNNACKKSFDFNSKAMQKMNTFANNLGKTTVATATGLVGLAVNAGATADDINTLAKVTGLSTEQIQIFKYASDRIDVSLDTLTGSMAKLTKNMAKTGGDMRAATVDTEKLAKAQAKAANATLEVEKAQINYNKALGDTKNPEKAKLANIALSKAQNNLAQANREVEYAMKPVEKKASEIDIAFDKLGVSVRNANGELRNNQDVFNEAIKALEKIENPTERDAIAMQIFGKSAQELNPLILGGVDALAEMGEEAKKAGLILSQDALDGANAFNDVVDKIKATIQAYVVKIGAWIIEHKTAFITITGIVLGLVGAFKAFMFIGTLIDLFNKLKAATEASAAAQKFLNIVMKASPIILIITLIAGLVGAFILLWNKCEWFRNFWIGLWDSIVAAFNATVNWFKVTFTQTIPSFFKSLTDWIGNVFNTDWSEKFAIIGNIINAFLANIKNVWDGIKQAFLGVIDFIKNVFTGNWSGAWDAVKNIFSGVFSSLLGIAKAPLNGIIGLLNMAIDGINMLIRGLNKISFDLPSWIPGIGGKTFGINIPSIPKIPMLAKGGVLHNGQAIVAEAGPELIQMMNGKAVVTPLSRSAQNTDVNSTNSTRINQTNNFYSPKALSPAETARLNRKAIRNLVRP